MASRGRAEGKHLPTLDYRLRKLPEHKLFLPSLALLCLVALASVFTSQAAAQTAVDFKPLQALEARGAKVSGLLVDLGSGKVLSSYQADQLLSPASTTKLVTAAMALDRWPAKKRFYTNLYARGPVSDGKLTGDLVLQGGGDATLIDEQLWSLAQRLYALGIREVWGDLRVNVSRFGQVPCGIKDRCDALERSLNSYDAPLSALGVNYSNMAVQVAPGAQVGGAASVAPLPFQLPSLSLDVKVSTDGKKDSLQAERVSLGDQNRFVLRGKVKDSRKPRLVYRSIAGAEIYAGEIFAQLMRQAGILFTGSVIVEHAPLPDSDKLLLQFPGAPLRDSLALMLGFSNNIIADTLALNLLVEHQEDLAKESAAPVKQGQEGLKLAEAGKLLQDFLRYNVAKSRFSGKKASQAKLYDGSGLTPENRLSSRDLVGLLDRFYRRTGDFPVFYGSLVVPGEKSKRSAVRRYNKKWQYRLAVKTGGLSEPVSVITIAGYLRFDDGGWGAFAMMINGAPGKTIGRWDGFEAMEKSLIPAFSMARK
ncbi:D-alanyl-D-alanine carboxypeptidase/D-alanyl-D-alanine endopeptidase [Rhodovibrionaceae bacterium A322]